MKEEQFLLDNFFLKKIKNNHFSRKYYSDFIYKEFKKGDLLFSESEPLSTIYFIKSGEVTATVNKCFIELNQMVELLSRKSKINLSDKEYEIKSNLFYLKNELLQKAKFKVL